MSQIAIQPVVIQPVVIRPVVVIRTVVIQQVDHLPYKSSFFGITKKLRIVNWQNKFQLFYNRQNFKKSNFKHKQSFECWDQSQFKE